MTLSSMCHLNLEVMIFSFSAKSSIEICVQEINNWMILNGLKLNEEKLSCFYSVQDLVPVLHWNLFVSGVSSFKFQVY